MSFRLKLLGSFLGLFAAVLAASLGVVGRIERSHVEEEANAAAASTRLILVKLLSMRESELASSLRLMAGDFAFKQALATSEPATVLSAAQSQRARIGSDLLLVADADGRLLADTRRLLKAGARAPEVAFDALAGKPASRLVALNGGLYQLVAVPVLAPDPIGVVVAGFAVDDALARTLRQLTGSDVSFAAEGRFVASTLAEPERTGLSAATAALEPGHAVPVRAGGRQWLAAVERPAPGVSVSIARSLDEALASERMAQFLLLAIGIFGLLVAALLGLAIASGLTSSLRKLAKAARQIGEGRFDVSIDIRSRDEVGRLGQTFLEMARGLVEREKIRSVLRKAVSKEIAESLLAQGRIELGGEEREVTVLFSDVRSFTTISEGLRPKELVEQLNEYFASMARAIDGQHGVIDKFVGDAIMALFGAPLVSQKHAGDAVRAALAMRAALQELNAARRSRGLTAWEAGIGLNTGTAVAGTLGSEDRWSYTVIGDAVNLASRLEGLTKHYGVPLIVSQSTRSNAGEAFVYRALDRVVVVGRHEPVAIFEVLAEGAPPSWLADYETGWEACRRADWPAAKAALERALEAVPEDGPTRRLLERARLEKTDEAVVMSEK